MQTLDLTATNLPSLELTIKEGVVMILTLKRVPLSQTEKHDAHSKELRRQLITSELEDREYIFKFIEHECEGFDREVLIKHDIDSYYLNEITRVVGRLRGQSTTAAKKNE